jgi:hypothetical protein
MNENVNETVNHEDHIGDEIADPWSDISQTDWSNNTTEVNG